MTELNSHTPTIHSDRRMNRRYDLQLDLSYIVHTGSRITLVGSGRSENLSSGGLMFRTGAAMDVDCTVIAALRWPLPSLTGEPLLLVVSGRVVWSDRDCAALALSRHEFMPEAQYRPTDLRSILPLRMISPRASARRGAAKSGPGRPMVLVVDGDDREGIIAKLLESYGYSVQYAERARALEMLASGKPEVDVVITANMAGFEPFAPRVPIILTAAEGGAAQPSAELARRVIRKPFVFRELVSAIQQLAGSSAERSKSNLMPMRVC